MLGWACFNWNAASITLSSVAVVSQPQNAVQSFTVKPAPITSLRGSQSQQTPELEEVLQIHPLPQWMYGDEPV